MTEYMQKHRKAAVGLCMGAAGTRPVLQTDALSCQPTLYPPNRRPILPTEAISTKPTSYPANCRPMRWVCVTEYMQKHREAAVGLCMGAAGTTTTTYIHTCICIYIYIYMYIYTYIRTCVRIMYICIYA